MKPLLVFLIAASSLLAAPAPQWGPTTQPLIDGAFAKEGLDTDFNGQSYSVGYETPLGDIHALLSIRNTAGAIVSTITAPPALMGGGQASCYAGVDAETTGASVFAVGTHFPLGINSPATSLLVTRWTPAGVLLAANTLPAIPGLAGQEVWGCRVVIPPGTILDNNNVVRSVVFVCGCTEKGMFVLCLEKISLALVTAWGNNGTFSYSNPPPTSCPKHPMPGIFPNQSLFASCRQSFIELSGQTLYLGGTLINAGLYGHTVARIRYTAPMAGFLVNPFGVRQNLVTGNSGMKALSVSGNPATALVTEVGGRFDAGWRATGVQVFANIGQTLAMPLAQEMNDVESVPGLLAGFPGNFVHVGGKHANNGQVFRFWFPVAGVNNANAVLQFFVDYGAPPAPANEVDDLAIGFGGWNNWTFATGGIALGASFDAPLLEVSPSGAPSLATPTNAPPTWPDRGNAALYHPGGTVFTHGNQQSTGPVLWYGRSVRWIP